MTAILAATAGLLGGGGAVAAGTAGTVGAGLGAATGGFSLASILQGTATVLGVVATLGAANADAANLELQAQDAERETALENLQGIERRTSIKKALRDSLGAQDVAYAASGVDLSFGTAASARQDAYREADRALTIDGGTQETRTARLVERAANYRTAAKNTKRMGLLNAGMGLASGLSSIAKRGG